MKMFYSLKEENTLERSRHEKEVDGHIGLSDRQALST
jgi:hypothetical protein